MHGEVWGGLPDGRTRLEDGRDDGGRADPSAQRNGNTAGFIAAAWLREVRPALPQDPWQDWVLIIKYIADICLFSPALK